MRSKTRAAQGVAATLMAAAAGCAFAQASAPASGPASGALKAHMQISRDCAPEYPEKAVKVRAQGETRMRFQVDADGHVTGAEIVEGSGHDPEHRLLDREAKRALSQCLFTPARDESGNAVASVTPVSYRWVLR